MNATQTRTGGVRKSLGRRIEDWLGGRSKPARGRARTSAALAVEGLEGRVVLTGTSPVVTSPIQTLASVIVQSAESVSVQQPRNLTPVINVLESPQNLPSLLNDVGVQFSVSSAVAGSATKASLLSGALENCWIEAVDSSAAIDLLTQPSSVPAADVASAFIATVNNMETARQTASADLNLYKIFASVTPISTGSSVLSSSIAGFQNQFTQSLVPPLQQILPTATKAATTASGSTIASQTTGVSPNAGNALSVANQQINDQKTVGSSGIANLYGKGQTFSPTSTSPVTETASNPLGLPSWDVEGISAAKNDLDTLWLPSNASQGS